MLKKKDKQPKAEKQAKQKPEKPVRQKKQKSQKAAKAKVEKLPVEKSGGGGNRKFVISIGDEGAIMVCMQGNKMVSRAFFASPAVPEFQSAISTTPEAPVYLLVDTVDQTYTVEELPPVSGANLKKLVDKKLQKDFDKNDIYAAIPINNKKSEKKEKQYLFVSTRNVPPLADWIETVSELPNPFEGVYLLPLESINYLKDLEKAFGEKESREDKEKHIGSYWHILVSHNRVGGFRQMVFRDRELVFTRIAQPIGGQTPDVVAGNIEQETLNALEYIRRLGYRDEPLDLYIVASGEVRGELDISGLPVSKTYMLTPFEIAEKLKLQGVAEQADRFGDVVILAHFVSIKKHIQKLTTDYVRKVSSMIGLTKAVKAVTAIAALGTIVTTGVFLFMWFSANSSIEEAENKKRAAQQKLQQQKEKNKELDRDPEEIKEITRINDILSKGNRQLLNFMTEYGRVEGYNTQVHSVKVSFDNDKEHNSEINVSLDVEIGSDGGSLEQMLDNINLFVGEVTRKFEGYSVEFSNLPTSIDLTGDKVETSRDIQVEIKGPKKKEEDKKGR